MSEGTGSSSHPKCESTPKDQETRRPRKPRKRSSKSRPVSSSGAVTEEASASNGHESLSKSLSKAFEGGEDFVAFSFSDTEDERPTREWDRGKRAHEGSSGKKRKFEDMERADRYGDKRQRLDNVPRKAPWVADVDWEDCNNVSKLLHREVEAFVRYVSPTPEEDRIRGFIVELISKAVSKSFPDAKVMPFGSFETKLYLPTGDIDLVIDSDSMAYSDKIRVLRSLANTMKRAGITDNVSIIAKAKVPIIKFVTVYGRLPVDISINQTNGVSVGKMINRFIEELPALRALVLVIKAFLNQRGMNEVFSGGLGSYSVVCLAVSFLQMHPKIRRGEIDPSKNLGVLLMEFFELYGYFFNYREVGVSIRNGGSYFSKAQRGWLDYSQTNLLSIEDPGDPSNDISRGTYGIAKVRATFAGAHGILTSSAFLHAGIISSQRESRYTTLRKQVEIEDMSILSSVLGITQETINHRKLVHELFYRGILHSMLGVPKPPTMDPSDIDGAIATKQLAKASVMNAWDGTDGDHSSDEDHIGSRGDFPDELEEEESRYTREPRKKRRMTYAEADRPTVYTTDEDDDDDADGLIVYDGSEDGRPLPRSRKGDRNRVFWLAKAGS